MKRAFAILAGLSLTALAAPAFAEKTPISQLPTIAAPHDAKTPPKTYGVPGLKVGEHQVSQGSTYYEVNATTKDGYCLLDDSFSTFLNLTESTQPSEGGELWRFTEKDGTATLERTRFELVTYLENAWVKSKTSVELHAVAKENGVTVWSMRQPNGDLVFLAKGAEGGREAHVPSKDEGGPLVGTATSSCSFGATQIDAAIVKTGGGIAQLNGSLPAIGEGKDKVVPRFTVDISAMKLSRDPEPEITVRVRVRTN